MYIYIYIYTYVCIYISLSLSSYQFWVDLDQYHSFEVRPVFRSGSCVFLQMASVVWLVCVRAAKCILLKANAVDEIASEFSSEQLCSKELPHAAWLKILLLEAGEMKENSWMAG